MKKSNFLILLFLSISLITSAQQLEVEGAIQSDSLLGTNSRLVQTDATGQMNDVPEGNLGEVLSQGPTGAQWAEMSTESNSNNNPCAPTYECPTEVSATTANGMYYGQCLRYCNDLMEGGHDDWRTPTRNELKSLFLLTAEENLNIWTTTEAFYETPDHSGSVISVRQALINMRDGSTYYAIVSDSPRCKCVR